MKRLITVPARARRLSLLSKTDARYTANVDRTAGAPTAARPLTHFVIDTSRNGQGTWAPTPGAVPDAETWCNPPGGGLGHSPMTASPAVRRRREARATLCTRTLPRTAALGIVN